MKKLKLLLGMAALAVTVTACAVKTAETVPAETEAETSAETMASYESKDGWKTTQGSFFTVKEDNEHQVSFICKTENPDKSRVIISYHPGKMPSEVLWEKTADIDDSRITRDEGYFGGLAPNWSYSRQIAEDPETGLNRQLNGTEHNGGTLLVDIYFYRTGDDSEIETVSDNITGLLDTLKFTNHEPQQELAYNVGTYDRKYKEEIEGKEQEFTDTITLNEDHTGMMSFQDDIKILWGSYQLTETESGSRYEFKVEGDTLFLNLDGKEEWLEFSRRAEQNSGSADTASDKAAEGDLVSTDYEPYAGTYTRSEDGSTVTLGKDGTVSVSIVRLTQLDGKATGIYKGIISLDVTDPNGEAMKMEFMPETGELVAVESKWNYIKNGETFKFDRKPGK